MVEFEDYYEILRVHPEATSREIKKAYRERCFVLHPDLLVGASDVVKKRAEQELIKANGAYDVLRHLQKRRAYHFEWLRRKAKPKPIVNPSRIVFRDMEPWRPRPSSQSQTEHRKIHLTPFTVSLAALVALIIAGITIFHEMQGKIVFQSVYNGNPEICVMNADGSNLKRLTNDLTMDCNPASSPNGSKIAFQSNRDGNYEIYVMNVNGGDLTRLTAHPGSDWHPVWSPDGSKIAFQSTRDGNPEIYVANADGTNRRRLTTHPAQDGYFAWSTDNKKIAFQSDRDGKFEIYTINIDGSNLKRLTSNHASCWYPTWSPDGSNIFFQSDDNGACGIYVMNSDGSNLKRLTNSTVSGRKVSVGTKDAIYVPYALSMDGSRIAFQSDGGGNSEIYVMNVDGSNLRQLTDHPASDIFPRWSPDGKKILFQSDRDGDSGIYVMNADGNNLRKLASNAAFNGSYTWSPTSLWLTLDAVMKWGNNLAKKVEAKYPANDSQK